LDLPSGKSISIGIPILVISGLVCACAVQKKIKRVNVRIVVFIVCI
jgi:hypothetical protein